LSSTEIIKLITQGKLPWSSIPECKICKENPHSVKIWKEFKLKLGMCDWRPEPIDDQD